MLFPSASKISHFCRAVLTEISKNAPWPGCDPAGRPLALAKKQVIYLILLDLMGVFTGDREHIMPLSAGDSAYPFERTTT
jgi:hypothetical protein